MYKESRKLLSVEQKRGWIYSLAQCVSLCCTFTFYAWPTVHGQLHVFSDCSDILHFFSRKMRIGGKNITKCDKINFKKMMKKDGDSHPMLVIMRMVALTL